MKDEKNTKQTEFDSKKLSENEMDMVSGGLSVTRRKKDDPIFQNSHKNVNNLGPDSKPGNKI